MRLRIVLVSLALFLGVAGGPAWAYWGGIDSLSDRIDALITIEALPLNAEVPLISNSAMPQRVFVDLVPLRTP